MDKISKIKGTLADKHGFQVPYNGTNEFYDMKRINSFNEGFDAAMELQLPVLFAKYLAKEFMLHDPLGWVKNNSGEWMIEEEIYKNWLSNLYTPEQK